jgi:hypothetical protein
MEGEEGGESEGESERERARERGREGGREGETEVAALACVELVVSLRVSAPLPRVGALFYGSVPPPCKISVPLRRKKGVWRWPVVQRRGVEDARGEGRKSRAEAVVVVVAAAAGGLLSPDAGVRAW